MKSELLQGLLNGETEKELLSKEDLQCIHVEVNDILEIAQYYYYHSESPLISDGEYDNLKSLLDAESIKPFGRNFYNKSSDNSDNKE